MGRMKELFMEFQEQSEIATELDFDQFMIEKMKSIEDARLRSISITDPGQFVSNCCGVDMNTLVSEDGPDFLDLGICPKCHDHCSVEEIK